MKILIADDHQIFREGLAALLKNMKGVTEVLQCTDGTEALEIVASNPVNIILMDIEMTGMNGIDTTRKIKKLYAGTVSVIVLTMFNRITDILSLYDAGADGYLLKDSSVKEVQKAIWFVAEGKEYYCNPVKRMLFKALISRDKKKLSYPGEILTEREKEILILICEQYSTEEIAEKLYLSPLTVNNHRRHILNKTQSKNVAGMVLYALNNNIYTLQ